MASNRSRKSSMAPSSHSLMSSAHVVWGQNATAIPSVTPASFTARRSSSVRSTYANRSDGVISNVRVSDLTRFLLSWERPPRLALGPDGPAVGLDDRPHDGQADPRAAQPAGPGRVGPVEPFEHERQVLRGGAHAGVRPDDLAAFAPLRP